MEPEGTVPQAEELASVSQDADSEAALHPAKNDTEVQIVEGEGILHPAEDSQPESEEAAPALYGAGADDLLATAGNCIPALYLSIDPEEFQKILDSPDHSYRSHEGTVRIELPEGYIGEFAEPDPAGIDRDLALEFIRGRGNSTWGAEKNPFKFKLEKSTDLLGMGKNKHWVLLANHYDLSLLRNSEEAGK